MSAISSLFSSYSSFGLVVAWLRQVIIAGAAVAGVLAMSGCAAPPIAAQGPQSGANGPMMRSPLATPSTATLFDPSLAPGRRAMQSEAYNAAVERERRAERQADADDLLRIAMVPPTTPPMRGANALRSAEKAIAPLADTLFAIDSAQRVVVENLRNVETAGFKASRTACGDGRDISSQLDLAQGELQSTQRSLDVAIQGEGFFQIQMYTPERPDGVIGFTRGGKLFVNREGHLVVGQVDGYRLIPPISLPVGTTNVQITQDGTLTVTKAADEKSVEIVRLKLARFADATSLQPLGGGIFGETEASGLPVESPAAERGAGNIIQGHIEASNVDLIRERMRLRYLQNWRSAILGSLDGDAGSVGAGQAGTMGMTDAVLRKH